MKSRTIVTTAIIASVLFTQSTFASPDVAAPGTIVHEPARASAAGGETVVKDNEVASSGETYAALLQRIKEDSLRQLHDKLDTRELIGDALGATVRSLRDAMLGAKPQL